MRDRLTLSLFYLGLASVACTDGPTANNDEPKACPPGTLGCACRLDATCAAAVCSDGNCRAARPCAEACAAHQVCLPPSATVDAICLPACVPGYLWNEGEANCTLLPTANCVPGAPDSIAEQCATLARECVTSTLGAECDGCINGYLEEADACRLPYSCATLPVPCSAGERCIVSDGLGDARCVSASCPSCVSVGEDGVDPTMTVNGNCICRTLPGYFYSLSGDVGTFPCDADHDGWVRDSARFSLESPDPVIRGNARCDLRRIDRVALHNESGQTHTVMFSEPLPLFETVRNDDQALLDLFGSLPAYGAGRALRATELNGMTKACVSSVADHNDNKVTDVEEWGRLPGAQSPITAAAGVPGDMLERVRIYTRFSYFVELHRGYYVASSTGEPYGSYHIREKPRLPASDSVPLVYGPEPNGGWTSDSVKSCMRGRDTWYSPQHAPIGLDFAAASSPGFSGMGHHSQFKCVHLLNQSEFDGMTPDERLAHRQRQTLSTLASLDWQLNGCRAEETSLAPIDGENPADPEVLCDPLEDPLPVGTADVLWAAVRLDTSTTYQRGCISTCAGAAFICPGNDPALPAPPCFQLCGDVAASQTTFGLSGGDFLLTGELPVPGIEETTLGVTDGGAGFTLRPNFVGND